MTPYSIRCGLFVFVRVDDAGRIVGRCLASSLRAAQGELGTVGVRSAASHAVPLPKAIAPPEAGCRLCGRALVPGGASFAGDVHERCRARSARASAAYKKRRSSARPTLKGVPRSAAVKAKIAATQRARQQGGMPTGKQLAALRDANVRRGILRRAAQREATGLRPHVKRTKPESPIPGGALSEMRARLAEALEPGRAKSRGRWS